MKLKYLYMGALAMTTLTACENLSTEPDGATLTEEKKKEMALLENYILNKKDIRSNEILEKHADWVDEWINHYEINEENIHTIVQDEISKVFVKVLECAGVYKRTEEGQRAFDRFIASL